MTHYSRWYLKKQGYRILDQNYRSLFQIDEREDVQLEDTPKITIDEYGFDRQTIYWGAEHRVIDISITKLHDFGYNIYKVPKEYGNTTIQAYILKPVGSNSIYPRVSEQPEDVLIKCNVNTREVRIYGRRCISKWQKIME